MTSEFLSLEELDGVYVARSGKLSGMAFRLQDGSLCLYSPVAGLENVSNEQQIELGTVSAILAPNHYHNKGLLAYSEVFPNASLYCSAEAEPRLIKITGLAFGTLDDLQRVLPQTITLHQPKGLKTGEVWVKSNSSSNCALIVTDAFSSPPTPAGTFGDRAGMLGTFPQYGVKDANEYKIWATEFISAASPSSLLPCHGSPVRSPDLPNQLVGLLNEAF